MSSSRRYILVALDTSTGSRIALRRAAELARRLNAELSGVFIQDQNLVRLAELPFAQELSTSGRRRALTAETMERELARQAAALERELEEVATSLDIGWSFQTRRGRVIAEIMAAFAGQELLAIGRTGMRPGHARLGSTARALLAEAGFPVMLIGPPSRRPERVLAVFNHSPSSHRLLERALELTPEEQPLQVLVWSPRREDLDSLESRVRELAGEHELEIHRLAGGSTAALTGKILALAPTTLVVGELEHVDTNDLEDLAGRLEGTVLRVRQARR